MLGSDLVANTYRYWCIKRALDNGRKILCLGHSLKQLKVFHRLFPGSALIIGDTNTAERTDLLRKSQICFAIARLGSVGVDDDKLDTLFWLSPFKSKIALQQSMGRIQRFREGKKQPAMIIFEDWMAPPLKKLCANVRGTLKQRGFQFSIIKPNELQIPTYLPKEVADEYQAAMAEYETDKDHDEED